MVHTFESKIGVSSEHGRVSRGEAGGLCDAVGGRQEGDPHPRGQQERWWGERTGGGGAREALQTAPEGHAPPPQEQEDQRHQQERWYRKGRLYHCAGMAIIIIITFIS